MSLFRRTFMLGGALSLAAPAKAQTANPDAMSIGAVAAPLELVEYASSTCPHCAHFHQTNWPALKANYIDRQRVRLTLHEMLTPPPAVAFGMFQLARCGGVDGPEYFRRIGILFERQNTILQSGTISGVLTNLVAIGAEWNLTEAQVMASLNDPAGSDRIMRSIAAADAQGVTSTPTFFLNGRRLPADFQQPGVLARTLDAALAG